MENQIIQKIKECLENFKEKAIRINQIGYITNQFYITNLIYKIKCNILTLKDEEREIYLAISLNEVYKVKMNTSKLILFLN